MTAQLLRVVRYFADPATCETLIRHARWPGGQPVCPVCGGVRIGSIATRGMLKCRDCQKQFSVKLGTLFEDSPLDLGQWFLCLFAVYHCPKITCRELSGLLGVTVPTAWAMRRKLRYALSLISKPGPFKVILAQVVLLPKSRIVAGLALLYPPPKTRESPPL